MTEVSILNAGPGAWAFEEHAYRLAKLLGVEVRDTRAELAYLLAWNEESPPACRALFIPFSAIQVAADKRLQAELFAAHGVPAPETHLLAGPEAVAALLSCRPEREWSLKFPTGCGASGHRLLRPGEPLPPEWPTPYVVQEFIRMPAPEVYRLYGVGGETFGWNVRRYPSGVRPSPWVAHAQGARYADAGAPPPAAEQAARAALDATGLHSSFGCVDLLHAPDGRWLALEVGADGLFNHVDRALGLPQIEQELDVRLRRAFRNWAGLPG
jgi:glutathione synthase/RimK-type ligase-like ATP-grasp enzyme